MRDTLGAHTTAPEVKHQAALYVCANAIDEDDARLLLEALGLA